MDNFMCHLFLVYYDYMIGDGYFLYFMLRYNYYLSFHEFLLLLLLLFCVVILCTEVVIMFHFMCCFIIVTSY